MSEEIKVGKKIRTFDSSPAFSPYTKIILVVSDELEYVSGDDTGRALTVECPWGTQNIADNLLAGMKGFQYQPFKATGSYATPAAELGDAVQVNDVYSRIYSQEISFGVEYVSDISAPGDEEIDHEYPYIPKQERRINRKVANVTADLRVQADRISAEVTQRETEVADLSGRLDVQANEISAEVSARTEAVEEIKGTLSVQAGEISAKVRKTGGDASSFGWALTDSEWAIKANGSDILKATKSGLEVTGKVTATSGTIGGFDIETDHISYNGMKWDDPENPESGVYIGPLGIRLGNKFHVDNMGNLVASSGQFVGTVTAGQILYGTGPNGENYGTLPGSALTYATVPASKLMANTITTTYTSEGINTSLAYADYSNDAFNGYEIVKQLSADQLSTDQLLVGGVEFYSTTITDGNGALRNVVSWRIR